MWVHLRAFRTPVVTVWIRDSLFSLQLRVLRDRYEFEYWLDHLCHVTLDYVFYSMSLVYFLLRAFVSLLLAWHILSLCCHLLDALRYVHDHLFTLCTYHEFDTPFFV